MISVSWFTRCVSTKTPVSTSAAIKVAWAMLAKGERYQEVAGTMQRQAALLLWRFGPDEPQARVP
jgi:hypothetical protein